MLNLVNLGGSRCMRWSRKRKCEKDLEENEQGEWQPTTAVALTQNIGFGLCGLAW
jgi:hypothetical protein